jgi:hypothetical protein
MLGKPSRRPQTRIAIASNTGDCTLRSNSRPRSGGITRSRVAE